MPVATVKPSLDEFIRTVHQEHPDVSETELTAYWNKTYGSAEPSTTSAVSLPSLPVFLKAVKETHPDIPEYELRDYWQQEYGSKGARETEPTGSDFTRGFSTSIKQVPQLAYGVVAGVGAAGESLAGDGGLLSGVKQAGVKGYQEWGKKIAKESKSSDSFSYAYNRAKDGDFEALVDFVQYGLGYAGGQAVQMLATAGVGSVGGKLVLGEVAKKTAEKMVAREAAALSAAEGAATLTAEQIAKQATANAAAKIGQMAALAATATGMEGGEIFGDLASRSMEEGRTLNGDELAKAFGTTLAAGALEFVGDKIGLDLILGRSPLTKLASSIPGMAGKVARGTMAAGADALTEGATEYAQTKLEQVGKGHDPFSDAAQREAIDSAALGVVGGAVVGGASGLLSTAKVPTNLTAPAQPPAEQPVMPASTPPAEQPVMPASTPAVSDILDPRSTLDQAIATALKIVDAPAVTPEAIDAAIDLANRTAVEGGLRLPTQAEVAKSEHPAEKRAGHPIPILNGPAAAKLGPTIEVGSPPKPLAEQEPDAREAIAAERARLLAMQRPKAPVQPEPEAPAAQPQPDKPLRTALELAYPSVDQIHALAESMGMKWDNDPTFMELTKLVTGKSHLDELTPFERQQFADKLSSIQAKTSGEPAAPTRSTTPKAAPPPVAPATDETATASGPEAMVSRPRHELPPIESDYLRELAEQAASRVASGQPGRRQSEDNINAPGSENSSFGSSYPDWYGELKMSRQDVFKALDKIIKDNGADVGAQVERVKEVILNDPELEAFVGTLQEWHAAATGTKKPPQTGPTPLPEELPTPAIQRGTTQPNALEPEAAPLPAAPSVPASTPIDREKARLAAMRISPESGTAFSPVLQDYLDRQPEGMRYFVATKMQGFEPNAMLQFGDRPIPVRVDSWTDPHTAMVKTPTGELHLIRDVTSKLTPLPGQQTVPTYEKTDSSATGSTDPAVIQPRHELSEEQSRNLLDRAETASSLLKSGAPGSRVFTPNLTGTGQTVTRAGSTYPKFYGPLKMPKDVVLKALDKIIKDKGEDVGRSVERVKEVILADRDLDHLVGEFPEASEVIKELRQQQALFGETEATPETPPEAHEFSTVQINLPPAIAQEITRMAARIPNADLAEDGREDQPHITVKYGLHADTADEVRAVLTGDGPITIKVGRLSIFQATDERASDVLKIDVESDQLRALNARITDELETTATQDDYKPHITVAYVKSGMGKKYAQLTNLLMGKTFTVEAVTFSDKNEQQEAIALTEATPKTQPLPGELFPGRDTMTVGAAPIIGREVQPEEAPLFSKQAQTEEPEQATLPGAPAARPQGIQDVGEKIGGARKDMAEKLGPRGTKPKDTTPGWRKRYEVSQIVKTNRPEEEGRWAIRDTRKEDYLGQARQIGKPYATKEEAEAAIPLVAVSRNHRAILNRDRTWDIYRIVTDRKRVKVVDQEFATEDDALRYMATHAEAIIETKTSFGEEILPRPETVTRVGPERRAGRNITAEDFKDTYGFRAVEFGLWNNQDERQEVMNHAYDGLADLAEILNIPSNAIGLNGELALAFGARGHGLVGARAHYERDYGVINLTKMQGAGSLAHEWFHATDHYFGRQDTKAKSEKERNKAGDLVYPASLSADRDYVSHGFKREGSGVRQEIRDRYTALIQTMFQKAEQYVEDTQRADKFVGEARMDVANGLATIRKYLAEKRDATYYKHHNEPATAEQLARFDGLAQKIIDGELLSLDWRASGAPVSKQRLSSMRWSNDAVDQISTIYKAVRNRSGFGSGDITGPLDELVGKMKRYSQRLRLLADAQSGETKTKGVPTAYAMEAKSIDQGRASEYWTTPHEMAARAFEAYIEDKVSERNGKSDFLVFGTNTAVPTPWGWKRPYPTGEERQTIDKAFDDLFDAIKTRETEKGVELYQQTYGQELFKDQPIYPLREGEDRAQDDQLALFALGDLDRAGHDVSAATGAVTLIGEPTAVRTVAVGISPDLVHHEIVNLHGYRVTSAEDLAKLAQVYRDPRFETFRVLYLKGDTIVGHEGVTSRMPGSTKVFVSKEGLDVSVGQWAAEKRKTMRRLGANGYWLLHNHPSGKSQPSRQDLQITGEVAYYLSGFKGHVIIDSNEYGTIEITEIDGIDFTAKHGTHPLDLGPDALLTPAQPHPLLGHPIHNVPEVARLTKHLQTPEDYVTVLYRNADGTVRAIQEMPIALFDDVEKAGAYLATHGLAFGSDNILTHYKVPTGQSLDSFALLTERLTDLIERGYLVDHVFEHPSGVAQGLYDAGARKKPGMMLGNSFEARRGLMVEQPTPDREAIEAYDPENAVSPQGDHWRYQTLDGTYHQATYPTKAEAIAAATRHQQVQRERSTLAPAGPAQYTEPKEGRHGQSRITRGQVRVTSADQDRARTDEGPSRRARLAATRLKRSDGQPATLYRGDTELRTTVDFSKLGQRTQHPTAGLGAFFSFSSTDAGRYGPVVSAFHLDLRNPKVLKVEDLPDFDTIEDAAAYRQQLQSQGHDGLIIRMDHLGGPIQVVAFAQDQIISKDDPGRELAQEQVPAADESLYATAGTEHPVALTGRQTQLGYAPAKPAYQLAAPSLIDNVIRVMEDKNIDIRRMVDAIKAAGREVSDNLNPVLHEEMYMGRLAKRTQDFLTDEMDPLVKAMMLNRVTLAQLDEYLHARHTKEANAYLKSINPDREDNEALSGMTDAEAERILGSVDKPKMERLAARVDAMVARTRNAMLEYGLESQDTVTEWAQQYAFYVPLHREGFEQPMGTGHGRSVRGPSTKARTGSTLKVTHILANIAMQRERTITRGEKMRPVIALAGLLMKNPNRDLAALAKPVILTYTDPETGLIMRAPGDIGDYRVPMIKVLNKKTGVVESRPDPSYKGRDNVVNFRLQGKDYAIVFNEHNERSMEMAKALKDLDVGQLNTVLAAVAPVTRYLASINTQYNPVFGIVNFIRDIQFAMLALSSTPLAGQRQDILSYTIKALRGIYTDARAIRRGERGTSDVSKLWERFQDVGGPTGYRDLFRTSTDRAKAIEHMLNPEWWQDTLGGKILTAGGVLSEAETAVLEKAAKPALHWLSDYNQTMENAVRLAVFQAGIKQGLSDLKAASLAKNITVNFNKKGQVATQMGAMFAFFNANIQGTARLAETLFARDQLGVLTQTGKKIIGGGMLVGALQAFALAMAGFDDDEPPEWLKARSLVIPVPGTDRGYISIPMALGFNLIPTIGRLASETLMHGRPGERGYRFLAAVLDAFSPVGGSSSLLQTIAPTVVKPIVALSENKDWTGRSIYKEDFNTLQPTPGFTRTKATASPWARGLAEIINYATLGTAYTPGKLSPTPDAIDYLIGVATGGMGRELSKTVQTVSAITSGEDLPTYKMPLIGRLVGSAGDRSATRERFYRNLKEINAHELEIKGRRENQEDITGYFEEHPEAKLVEAVNITEREVSALNRRKRDLIKRGASREQVSQIEDRIAARMERLNERVEQMVKP